MDRDGIMAEYYEDEDANLARPAPEPAPAERVARVLRLFDMAPVSRQRSPLRAERLPDGCVHLAIVGRDECGIRLLTADEARQLGTWLLAGAMDGTGGDGKDSQ